MSLTGNSSLRILAPVALDSTNEEDILLSLHYLLRGLDKEAHLKLYHALTPDKIRLAPTQGESFLHQIEVAQKQAEEKLRRYQGYLSEKLPASVVISYHIQAHEVAAPAEEILSYLRTESFSLMTLSFKQRRRWERFFGTTALWDLLEEAPIPILLLSAPLTIPPRRLLWLTSMQSESFPLLKTLVPFVHLIRGTLYCAKVNTPTSFITHRTFQRHVLDMCDYIIDHVDPDFIPEECLLYADKDIGEGAVHVAQDFLIDVVVLDTNEALSEWKLVDKLLSQQIPILLLRKAK